MVTIGNDTLAGTITTLESATSVGVGVGSPGTPVIIGQGYLRGSNANADADSAQRITRSSQARNEFGDPADSQLTRALQDALSEGAYPVYGIAPSEVEVTDEDLSGNSGQTGTLSNAPVQEVAEDITFTINSTIKDTVLYRDGDPEDASPGTDEVYLNPVTGKFNADESMGVSGDSVDYWYLDYADTFDEINNYQVTDTEFLRDLVDFAGLIPETAEVVDSLEAQVDDMESNGDFAIGLAGAGDPYIDDTSSYSDDYDNSRMQLIYPSRDGDGNTIMGSYVGARSRIGISSTPIFKRLQSQNALQTNLSRSQKEELVLAKVNPIEERGGAGARILDDLTTVADDNTDEQAWTQGISRLVTDFIAETVRERSEPFIGSFNDRSTLNSLRGNLSSELKSLLESRQLEAYSLVVEATDNTTAVVDIGVDTADPLRNIELTVSAGAVENGVSVESE